MQGLFLLALSLEAWEASQERLCGALSKMFSSTKASQSSSSEVPLKFCDCKIISSSDILAVGFKGTFLQLLTSKYCVYQTGNGPTSLLEALLEKNIHISFCSFIFFVWMLCDADSCAMKCILSCGRLRIVINIVKCTSSEDVQDMLGSSNSIVLLKYCKYG